LATWEIVDQVVQVRDDSPHPVRGVVFMGMGDPMLPTPQDVVTPPPRLHRAGCGNARGPALPCN
jgi:23S rRNA (adenine2503-C2)-methyltransferase